ncbi:hypothetical protein F1559_002879 [Cyanidiococcus yangmingshanensis]|uniref:Lipoyl-binding domain-containing protein n=1 Tax=Cyanidiococcus yangmingshanensis TaxID=2690220 RepID=A0A7J7IGY3_9RHOD|nr:hypothetical protein F1559_002879 [Cyanidiococcus yangmingshanensis]
MAFLLFLQSALNNHGGNCRFRAREACSRSSRLQTWPLTSSSKLSTAPGLSKLVMKTKRHNVDEMDSVKDNADEARNELRRGEGLGAGTAGVSVRGRASEAAASSREEHLQRSDGVMANHAGLREAAGLSGRGTNQTEAASEERLPDLTLTEIQEFLEVLRDVTLHCGDVQLRVGNTVIEISRPDGRGFDEFGELRAVPSQPATDVERVAPTPVDRRSHGSDATELSTSATKAGTSRRIDASAPSFQTGTQVGRSRASTTEQRPRYDDVSQVLDTDFKVVSNRVGFFHAGPSSRPPFVKVGDRVEVKRPVCMIEQLGNYFVYNAEVSGTVIKVCVEDGAPVEYGQELVIIRPE